MSGPPSFAPPVSPVPAQVRRLVTDAVAAGQMAVLLDDTLDALVLALESPERCREWTMDLATELGTPFVCARTTARGDLTALNVCAPPTWSAEKVAGWMGGHAEDLEAVFESFGGGESPLARPFRLVDGRPPLPVKEPHN